MNLSIIEAWNELDGINNQINLFETLKETNNEETPKSVRLKEILVSGGKVNNDTICNAIINTDKYSEKLLSLYISKTAYEKYILEEIRRLKISAPAVCIAFLKEYQKLTWKEMTKVMDYSIAQCRRYYDEFKGKTPKNNSFLKDEQK